jgi:RNA polymerase sigma factor (sigma-70 family)
VPVSTEVTPAQIDELMRLVGWHLRTFAKRADWDDILGIGYMGMWHHVQLWQKNPRYSLKNVALKGAMWFVLTYVKKAKRVWEYELPLCGEAENEEGDFVEVEWLCQEDFTPRIHAQMEAEESLRDLTESEREILMQYYVEGYTFQEIAHAHGHRSKTWGFNNVRAAEKKLRVASQETPLPCRI